MRKPLRDEKERESVGRCGRKTKKELNSERTSLPGLEAEKSA